MQRTRTIARVVLVMLAVGVTALAQERPARRLPPGYEMAISGRVTDARGGPVAGAFVTLLQEHPRPDGSIRIGIYAAGFGVETNADGGYKLDNLRPGTYYVVALPPMNGAPATRSGFRMTYFPGVAEEKTAKAITLRPGQSHSADIAMIPATLATVTGIAYGEDQKPAAGGVLRIARGDGLFGMGNMAVQLRAGGDFSLPGMPPGKYFLSYNENGPRPAPGKEWQPAWETVVVDGRDITGVRVAPVHAVRITGKLILSDEMRKAFPASAIRVTWYPFDVSHDGNPGPPQRARVNDDLTFEAYGWPQRSLLRVFLADAEARVTAIRVNGRDVSRTGFAVTKDTPVSGVEIEIATPGRVR